MTSESRYKRWKRKTIAKKRMVKRIKRKKTIQKGKGYHGGTQRYQVVEKLKVKVNKIRDGDCT